MYLCYCDLCNLPIKEGDKKFIFMINETKQPNLAEENLQYNVEATTSQDLLNRILEQKQNIKTYEICDGCQRVMNHFINLRASKVKKISEILDKLDKKETIILPEGENGNV